MNEAELIKTLQKEMQQMAGDIKAEAQLFLAREKGLWPEYFFTNSGNQFRREYSRDIISTEIREDAGRQILLELYLSRGGIYDQLPEGLFFKGNSKRKASVTDLAADHRANKKIEAQIRKFFQPLDHDFFLQRLNIEEEENLLLEGLQSGILNEYFIRFWNLPTTIPRSLLAPLILLLPYASKIAGDETLMANGLELILNEEVKITQNSSAVQKATGIDILPLGEAQLGLDMVCGDNFAEEVPVFEICIGPLVNSKLTEYLEGGNRYLLLETFERFFIPFGIDIVTDVLVSEEKRNMVLARDNGPVLGYSSYL